MTTQQRVLKFYVSGPVGKRTKNAIDRWRTPIQVAIEHLNHKPIDFKIDAPDGKQRTSQEIVADDLRLIDECDAVIAYVDNGLSAGSCMEIFYAAHVLHKSVYVIDCTSERLPKWIAAHATRIYRRGENEWSLRDFIMRRTMMACEHAATVADLKTLELDCTQTLSVPRESLISRVFSEITVNSSLDIDGKVVRTATEEKARGTWTTVRKDTLENLRSLQADLHIIGRVLPLPEGYGIDEGDVYKAGPLSKSRDSWNTFPSRGEAVIAMWIRRENGRKTALEAGAPCSRGGSPRDE